MFIIVPNQLSVTAEQQLTMSHILDMCLLTKLEGRLHSLHDDDDAPGLAGNSSRDIELKWTTKTITDRDVTVCTCLFCYEVTSEKVEVLS